jgi:ribonuclease R
MSQFVGQVFTGLVNGFIDKGFFVELKDNKCEGMVTFDQFDEPYYVAENKFTAMGKHSGHVIRLGDELEVRIFDADLEKRRIELQLTDAYFTAAKPK